MLNLSASQIKQYASCRFQYFDKYKLHKFGAQDTSGLLGTAVHKAIEMRYKANANPLAVFQNTVMDTLNNWQDTGTEVSYTYNYASIIEQGRSMLGDFTFAQFQPAHLEYKFSLPFLPSVLMRGYIDLITTDGIVVDFKTAGRKPKTVNDDWQFAIYSWAYVQLFNEYPKAVYWYHLRTQEEIPFELDASYETELARVIELAETLRDDPFLEFEMCPKCPRWCIARKAGIV
jgi:hypothetical protein